MASLVDHARYVANEFTSLGAKTVNTFYSMILSTIPILPQPTAGANVVAAQLIEGVMCADNNALAECLENPAKSVSGSCISS